MRHPLPCLSQFALRLPTLTPSGRPTFGGTTHLGGARGPYVVQTTTCRSNREKPSWKRHLTSLATRVGEKCELGRCRHAFEKLSDLVGFGPLRFFLFKTQIGSDL